jgi:transposase
MPISRWNFIGDAATPHVGPMAQDFHAAFGLGTDDKHIATVDADGVALAAIQGLNQKLEEAVKLKTAKIQELEQRLEALEKCVRDQQSTLKNNHS